MPEFPSFGLIASIGAGLLFCCAVLLLTYEASQDDLVRRVRGLTRPAAAPASPTGPQVRRGLIAAIARVGEVLRGSAFLSARDVEEMGNLVQAAGYQPRRAVPIMAGAKFLLLLVSPVLALGFGMVRGYAPATLVVMAVLGATVGMLLPNWGLRYAKSRYHKSLRLGLPDALDLLVICAEAGLGLESALDRVATELRGSHAAVAVEFSLLVQEMRLLPDREQALLRPGERTGIESLQRLGSSLAQSLRFGTPLREALRVLASEMRTERMIRIEEQTLRLPALLTMPLILFILPCLFIVLAGPSVIQLADVMGK
jgi:tight adherence protein C